MNTEEQIISIDKVDSIEKAKIVLDFISARNDPKYNMTKLAEELTELSELILKSVNKKPEHKPDLSHIIEEIGDVSLRLYVYISANGISSEQIDERIIEKSNRFLSYIKEKKYNSGV